MPPNTVSSVISPAILPILSFAVFFIGATEFMLSPMLKPLAEAFKTTTNQSAWLVSGYNGRHWIVTAGSYSDTVTCSESLKRGRQNPESFKCVSRNSFFNHSRKRV
ncbi:arabinose ABC transporter permease [Xenorhabdus beddingii]|uniref:Arabinose ABC transporter permease n=1 Tax=Xenorhabdus beddingii TaxID=40578 RepID=A0A1Y2SMU2_9GAMM|nr:arabinose ABC transporter permease [Xenorhabdus beddingii]